MKNSEKKRTNARKCTRGSLIERKGYHQGPKWTPRGTKTDQKAPKWSPKGTTGDQNGAKWKQRGAKGSLRSTKKHPKIEVKM